MKKQIKKNKNIFTRITIFSIWIIILSIISWIAFYKINTFFGDSKTTIVNTGDNMSEQVDNTLKKEEVHILFAGLDEDKTRTDTMIFAKYDTVNNKLYMMSIPRDTYTSYIHSAYRINTIYGYGGVKRPTELVNQIEKLLDTTIDYYVVIDIAIISEIVEKIGSLEIELDRDVSVHYMSEIKPRFTLKKGITYNLKAKEVEDLSRNRWYPEGDIERGRVQRQIIVALIQNLVMAKNIWKIPSIMKGTINNTDTNITFREAMKYVSELKEIDMDNIISENMPLLDMNYQVDGNSTILINKIKAREIIASWKYTSAEATNDK